MRPVFRPTEPKEEAALSAFLARIFQWDDGCIFMDPALMQWKYWRPRSDWDGSRSYVIERDATILAHGAAWPLHLELEDGPVRGFFWIDWAADPSIPGIGAALMQRMARAGGLVWTWGGTPQALKMRAAMGFAPRHAVPLYARPLRPFRQALVRADQSWKALPHFVRNFIWALAPMRVEPGWTAVPADEKHLWVMERKDNLSALGVFHFRSSPEFLRYLSECPVARLESFRVCYRGEDIGALVLMYVPGQARIVYALIDDEIERGWLNLYALALRQAMQDPQSYEITTWCAVPVGQRALTQLGFRERSCNDLMVYDPEGKTPKEGRFHLQMLHGDGAFLHPGHLDFIT